ncbi:Hypothetical_protein [Hexamita inflata]|uniref:Hypothetical_protein n=1 Tax=Hexamita inflata TaxID=28002 RepID=A0AA86UVF8_9EUKA|nr:Hypothetical protein HINF_LOCUS54047 [Hexamita inflata]
MQFVQILSIVFSKSATDIECQNLLLRVKSTRYCEKVTQLVDKTVTLNTITTESFSLFINVEMTKNLILTAVVQSSTFSTFALTGDLIVENCQIEVTSTSSSSALLSLAALQVLIVDSSFTCTLTPILNDMVSATLVLSASQILINRSILSSVMHAQSGILSGFVCYSPKTYITSVTAYFNIQAQQCGSISANIDNAIIIITSSNISGSITPTTSQGILVGSGNNVTIDVSIDSYITISGPFTDFNTNMNNCNGICGPTNLPVFKVFGSITSSSAFIFSTSSELSGSKIIFDANLNLIFTGNFSIIKYVGNIQNINIQGQFSATGAVNSYANIISSNITTSVTFIQIQIQVSVQAQSLCKLNLISNSVTAQITINSLVVTGTYSTVSGGFSMIWQISASVYTPYQSSNITNYQFQGIIQTTAPSSLIVINVLLIDLTIMNSNFTVTQTFNISGTSSILIKKFNSLADNSGILIVNNIKVMQSISDQNINIIAGILFNYLYNTQIVFKKITVQYSSKSNIVNSYQQTIFGIVFSPNITIAKSKFDHYIYANILQRIGLLSVSIQAISALQTNNIQYNLYASSSGDLYQMNDFGLLGVYTPTLDYSTTQATITNSTLESKINVQIVNQNQNQYFGVLAGKVTMQITAYNLKIYDSFINAPTSKYVGIIGSITSKTNFSNLDVQNLQISALSYSGLFAYFSGPITLQNISFLNSNLYIQQPNVYSASLIGTLYSSTISITNIIYKNLNYTTPAPFLSSSLFFGSFYNSIALIQNCKLAVNSPSNIYFYSQLDGGQIDVVQTAAQLTGNCIDPLCRVAYHETSEKVTYQ